MTPTFHKVLMLAVQGALKNVRVALPGVVVAYDKRKQRADVQPLINDRFEDETGEIKPARIPVCTDVPVMFQGAGEYSETFPISKGDTVLLVFCSSATARWKVKGGETDPADDRHHALSDAVAYAGVRDFAHALEDVPDDAWVITVPDGDEIRLGSSSASDQAAHVPGVQAALIGALTDATILDATYAYNLATPGAPKVAALAALVTAVNAYFGSNPVQGSAKVKVE